MLDSSEAVTKVIRVPCCSDSLDGSKGRSAHKKLVRKHEQLQVQHDRLQQHCQQVLHQYSQTQQQCSQLQTQADAHSQDLTTHKARSALPYLFSLCSIGDLCLDDLLHHGYVCVIEICAFASVAALLPSNISPE